MTKLGRKNSLNIDILEQYNQVNELHKNAILYTFESTSLSEPKGSGPKDIEEIINTSGKKHAVRKFILDIILWLRIQEEE